MLPKAKSLVLFKVISHLFDVCWDAFCHEQIVFSPNHDGSINQLCHDLIRDQIDAIVRWKCPANILSLINISKQSWEEAEVRLINCFFREGLVVY